MTTTLKSRGALRRSMLALAALGVAAVASGCGLRPSRARLLDVSAR